MQNYEISKPAFACSKSTIFFESQKKTPKVMLIAGVFIIN